MHRRNKTGVVVYWCRRVGKDRRKAQQATQAAEIAQPETGVSTRERRSVGQQEEQQPVAATRIVAIDRDPAFSRLIEAARPTTLPAGRFGALVVSDAYFNAVVRPAPPGRIGQLPLPLQQRGLSAFAAAGSAAFGIAVGLIAAGIAFAPAPALASAAGAAGGTAAGGATPFVVRGLLTVAANDNARRAAAALLLAALQSIASSAEAAERSARAVVAENPHVVQIVELEAQPAVGERLPGGYRVIAVFMGQ
jgi:hypothetical protein